MKVKTRKLLIKCLISSGDITTMMTNFDNLPDELQKTLKKELKISSNSFYFNNQDQKASILIEILIRDTFKEYFIEFSRLFKIARHFNYQIPEIAPEAAFFNLDLPEFSSVSQNYIHDIRITAIHSGFLYFTALYGKSENSQKKIELSIPLLYLSVADRQHLNYLKNDVQRIRAELTFLKSKTEEIEKIKKDEAEKKKFLKKLMRSQILSGCLSQNC